MKNRVECKLFYIKQTINCADIEIHVVLWGSSGDDKKVYLWNDVW